MSICINRPRRIWLGTLPRPKPVRLGPRAARLFDALLAYLANGRAVDEILEKWRRGEMA